MAFCCKTYTLPREMTISPRTIAISRGKVTISLCKVAICPRTIAISRGKVAISQGKMAISPRTIAISWGKVTISLCKVAISLLIMVTLPQEMAIVCGILYVLDF